MIRHVVVITWKPEATAEQKQQASDGLATLPALMSGLRSYMFGPDVGVSNGNADFAIVADFDDVDVLRGLPRPSRPPRGGETVNRADNRTPEVTQFEL